MRRQEYINSIRHWMGYLEPSLSSEDEREWANAGLLPPLTVLALEGDERSRDRIERILRRVIQTPPWDDKNHYFSALDRLGLEPHGGNTQMGLYLCNAVQHSEELGLPTELKETVLDIVRKMLARWARFSDHAKDAPAFAFLDQEGHTVNVGAVRAELIRKGIPEDFSYLREIGPKNQVCAEMRSAAHLYLLTRDEEVWSWVEGFWNRVLDRVEDGRPYPYPICFDPDYSFVYSIAESHRYETSMYAIHIFGLYADVVRIAREIGRPNPVWEEFIRNWSAALFTRAVLSDGTCNMVLNGYGWERCFLSCATRAHILHTAIPIADLTPLFAGELRYLADSVDRIYREWNAQETYFAGDLGLKGYFTSTPSYSLFFLAQEYGSMLLSNPASVDVEPVQPDTTLFGYAWAQNYAVMQTPSYHLTAIGSGTGLHPNGLGDPTGFGVVPSGGEYVIRIPGGRYLTPISPLGRPSVEVRAGGITLSSSELRMSNREEYGFRMRVTLRTGETIVEGAPYGPLAFDPHVSDARMDISYGKGPIRMGRTFDLDPQHIRITDGIEALEPVEIEYARTRFPLITVAPDGLLPRITGQFGPVAVEIKPPRHMGSDVQRPDQDFIKSLRAWDWLRMEYPECVLEIQCLTPEDLRFDITAGEWHEDSRMRVDGKNLDVFWVHEPIRLDAGERREFKYEVRISVPASQYS